MLKRRGDLNPSGLNSQTNQPNPLRLIIHIMLLILGGCSSQAESSPGPQPVSDMLLQLVGRGDSSEPTALKSVSDKLNQLVGHG